MKASAISSVLGRGYLCILPDKLLQVGPGLWGFLCSVSGSIVKQCI